MTEETARRLSPVGALWMSGDAGLTASAPLLRVTLRMRCVMKRAALPPPQPL